MFTSNPRTLTFNGETKKISQWSKKTGLSVYTINWRIGKKWPIEHILSIKTPEMYRFYHIGKRFGMLTIVECLEENNGRENACGLWKCVCDCGNNITKMGRDLNRTGRLANCGCANNENPIKYDFKTGEKIGRYTVLIRVSKKGEHGHRGVWRVKCDCGMELEKSGLAVMKDSWHNGCSIRHPNHLSHPRQVERMLTIISPEKRKQATINAQYAMHRERAKSIQSDPLSREDWLSFVFLPCAFCGDIDTRAVGWANTGPRVDEIAQAYNVKMNGIDRIDSFKPYSKENSLPCCGLCNWLKNNSDINVFLDKIKAIYEHRHLISR